MSTETDFTTGSIPTFDEPRDRLETDEPQQPGDDTSAQDYPSGEEAEDHIQALGSDEDPAPKPAKRKASAPRSKAVTAAQRKRIAAQTIEDIARFSAADETTRDLAASLLKCSATPEVMAVEAAAGTPAGLKTVSSLTSLKAIEDGLQRVMALGELNYETDFADAWSLMHQMGLLGRKRPNSQIKAVTEMAKAIDEIDNSLEAAVELING